MKFACDGVVKHTGPFALFDQFRDFRSWACNTFALGRAEGSRLYVYNAGTREWASVVITDPFQLAPYYKVVVRHWDDDIVSVITLMCS
jgi:hypothetical protein